MKVEATPRPTASLKHHRNDIWTKLFLELEGCFCFLLFCGKRVEGGSWGSGCWGVKAVGFRVLGVGALGFSVWEVAFRLG